VIRFQHVAESQDRSFVAGIYKHLTANFHLLDFRNVQTREALTKNLLPAIAAAAKRHSLLSSHYFYSGPQARTVWYARQHLGLVSKALISLARA